LPFGGTDAAKGTHAAAALDLRFGGTDAAEAFFFFFLLLDDGKGGHGARKGGHGVRRGGHGAPVFDLGEVGPGAGPVPAVDLFFFGIYRT